MYEITGWYGDELKSRHYSNDKEYVDIVKQIEWFKTPNGVCIDLVVKPVAEEGKKINDYVGWIKEIVKYYKATGYIAHDCRDIPEFY